LGEAAFPDGDAVLGAEAAGGGAPGALLAVGAVGFGCWSRSHACQSMSTEKPKMKSRIRRWVSIG
jgi:hypothetical protein